MKEWKNDLNRYELFINNKSAFVLYYKNEYDCYARTYLDGSSVESVFPGFKNLDEAKVATEKWYMECLRKNIAMHKDIILMNEMLLEEMSV